MDQRGNLGKLDRLEKSGKQEAKDRKVIVESVDPKVIEENSEW